MGEGEGRERSQLLPELQETSHRTEWTSNSCWVFPQCYQSDVGQSGQNINTDLQFRLKTLPPNALVGFSSVT